MCFEKILGRPPTNDEIIHKIASDQLLPILMRQLDKSHQLSWKLSSYMYYHIYLTAHNLTTMI